MLTSDVKAIGRRVVADTTPEEEVGYLDVLPAAFRTENSLVSALNNKVVRAEFDPEYDPIAKIPGQYQGYARRYALANSDAEVQTITQQIDREVKDRDLIGKAGADGVLALLTAGVLDPINLIPVGGVAIRSAKTGEAIAQTAKAGFVSTAAAEVALQSTQETRTATESAIAITAGTFIGGLLGAGANQMFKQLDGKSIRPIAEIEESVNSTVGAAQVMDAQQEYAVAGGGAVQAALKVQGIVDPTARLLASKEPMVTSLAEKLFETPLRLAKNEAGVATAQSAESIARSYDADLFGFLRGLDDSYTEYAIGRSKRFGDKVRLGVTNIGTGRMSFTDFKEAVGKAARRGDSAKDLKVPEEAKPHIESAAAKFRKVADKLKDDAIAARLLPDDVDVETAPSYLNRVYNTKKIAAKRNEFRAIVTKWLEDTSPDLNYSEVSNIVEDVMMRIEGLPDGRLGKDVGDISGSGSGGGKGSAKKGTFKKRTFLIPDELIEEFLEDDIELLSKLLTRNMAPDIGIAKSFDTTDVNLDAQINEIRRSYEAKMEGAKDPEKVRRQMERELEDFAAVRDRLRGVFGLPSDPKHLGPRAGQALRTLSYIRLLGGMTLSAIPDLGRTVMVHGVTATMRDFVAPLVANLKGISKVNKELRDMGVVAEMLNNTRAQAIADISDTYGRRSKAERALGNMGDTFGMVSLMSPWNDALKTMAGSVTQARLIRAIRSEAAGSIKDKERLFLRENGIGAEDIAALAKQLNKHGSDIKGMEISGWANWTDRDIKDKFEQAINRETRKIIVTPGQDRALIAVKGRSVITQETEIGKMMVQFKAFGIAASQRMLISGMQQKDLATLNGVLLTLALGMLTYGVKEKIAGRDVPDFSDNPEKWVIEGVDRSGLMGWLTEPNNILEKMTRGNVGLSAIAGDTPMSRYASRSIPEAVMGPVLGTFADLTLAASGLSSAVTGDDDLTESEIHTIRKTLPYQNLFYLRWLFDQLEETTAEAID